MPNNQVVPLSELHRRIPEAGRIRFGVKTERAMKAIDTFRFTSTDKAQLERLAAKYGGTVKAWSPSTGRNEWEVITEAHAIDVVVPPHALGDTPLYELWSRGGCQRRCNGVTLMIPSTTPDGVVQLEQPCICDRKGVMECKPITRLQVLIPDIPFTGVWRMDTGSWYAAHELPGMVDMVVSIQDAGFARATLALEQRHEVKGGQTKHFIVPVLRTPATLEELAAGAGRLATLGPAAPRELASGSAAVTLGRSETEGSEAEDDVVEAEIVDDDEISDEKRSLTLEVYRYVNVLDLSTDDVRGFVFAVTEGAEQDLRQLEVIGLRRVVAVLEKIHRKELEYAGLRGQRATVRKAA